MPIASECRRNVSSYTDRSIRIRRTADASWTPALNAARTSVTNCARSSASRRISYSMKAVSLPTYPMLAPMP
jgi:hypothetical protein